MSTGNKTIKDGSELVKSKKGLFRLDEDSNYFFNFDNEVIYYSGEIIVIDGEEVFRIFNPDKVIYREKGNAVYILDKEGDELEIIIPNGEFTVEKAYGEIWYNFNGEIISLQTFRTKEIYEKWNGEFKKDSNVLDLF